MDIQVYVISGFLGAGKTSFLQQFLTHLQTKKSQKLAVLINELGSVSIDGDLLSHAPVSIEEITSGSIYCYCKQDDFVKVLKQFSNSDIDILLIENSGMADPSNLHELLSQGEEKRAFHYQGGICLLDAMTFYHHVQVLPAVENQVKSSSLFLLNKVDMVPSEQVKLCREEILRRNPQGQIYETVHGTIPMELIEEQLFDNGFHGETTNKCYNKFSSYALETKALLTETEVLAFAHEVKKPLYRAKGFVETKEGWFLLDTVGEQVEFRPVALEKRQKLKHSKLVFIGQDETDFDVWLLQLWKEIINKPVELV